MNEEEVQKQIDETLKKDQYGVAFTSAHTHNGTDSMQVDEMNITNKLKYILYRIVQPTVSTVIGTSIGGDLVMPFTGYVTGVGATVDTAGTTGLTTLDFKKTSGGVATSILTAVKVTIDSTEKSSRTAVTPPILDGSKVSFQTGDIFDFDVTTVNTTPAKGLTVFMNVTIP